MKRRAAPFVLLVAGIAATASSAAPTVTYRAAIYSVRSDGSGRVLIAEPDPPVPSLVRSPGGRSILFHKSTKKDEFALYAAELTGANPVRLSPPGLSVTSYGAAFSPDGQTIAFSSFVICGFRCTRYTLHLVRRDGTGLRVLADEASVPSWSPDGTRLAYQSVDGISVVDLGTGVTTVVARRAIRPIWAPRGERIAYSGVRGYGVACFVNADGSHRVCTRGHSLTALTWSRDGTRVAFRQATPRRLGIVNAYTGRVRLLGYRGRWALPAGWSPDGRRLAYGLGSFGSFSGRMLMLNVAKPHRPRVLFDDGDSRLSDLRWRAGGLTYVAVRSE